MTDQNLRETMVRLARSLFERGFSVGTAGNISARLDDGSLLVTPTNSWLGSLVAERISHVSPEGKLLSGDPPSKEIFLHRAFYAKRPQAGAVVHLHSTYATALSCLADLDPQDCVPAITPYVVMRVGAVKLLPYFPPGDPRAADLIAGIEESTRAVLLANHGPVVTGPDLGAAVAAAEELEETCKLLLLLRGQKVQALSAADVAELKRRFPG